MSEDEAALDTLSADLMREVGNRLREIEGRGLTLAMIVSYVAVWAQVYERAYGRDEVALRILAAVSSALADSGVGSVVRLAPLKPGEGN